MIVICGNCGRELNVVKGGSELCYCGNTVSI